MKGIDAILDRENLRLAWEEVAERGGAPGIDNVSIKRWRRNWEERLTELAGDVRANCYRPSRLRWFNRPKKDGSWRRISILTVTDRVLQRAVLRVVDDLFDRQFLPCSFGYRAGLGVRQAIPVILSYRDSGRTWVFDADIDDCFNSLDHDLILELFSRLVNDAIVMRLVQQWLQVASSNPQDRRGIPLGAVLSPLFCNIVLHQLDLAMTQTGFHLVRYADDFCAFCTSPEEAQAAWSACAAVLNSLHLRLEPAKTAITCFDQGFDFLGVHFYRDIYSFKCQKKRIEVKGAFDPLVFYDYVPDGYED